MKSQFGFKSEIWTKKHGRLTLMVEREVTATTRSQVADELKKTGEFKAIRCWDHRYKGRGGVGDRFFVLAFA